MIILGLGILLFLFRYGFRQVLTDDSEDISSFIDILQAETPDAANIVVGDIHKSELNLISFNPNEVSKDQLSAMGLPPSVVKSIINYRNSGYQYRRAEDLLRCYGMDQELFDQIAPYVVILDQRVKYNNNKSTSRADDQPIRPFSFDPNIVSKDELIQMNLPDKFIKGFLNYRKAGAKFYNENDFGKLYVLTPELKTILLPYLTFPSGPNSENKKSRFTNEPSIRAVHRFNFDPNTISKDSLMLLGIRESVANTWINFRNRGKIFYQLEDLQTIYGLSADQLADLVPLINFPKITKATKKTGSKLKQPSLQIDPNKATTEDLEAIKGIGAYYAKQIIWQRDVLGGFYSIDQIGEAERLPDSTFQQIKYHFVEPSIDNLVKININTTRRRVFADHPYMTYDRVNRIITHREFVGKIENIEYLLKVELLTSEEAKRIGPYLTFD